jgi:transaldolase
VTQVVTEVVWSQQDVDDELTAASLCERLAEKISARKQGSTSMIVAQSIKKNAERHRERAARISKLLPQGD